MKKITKTLLTAFLSVFMVIALAACGQGGEQKSSSKYAGTYILQTVTLSTGETFTAEETGYAGTLILNEDGSGTFEAKGAGNTVTENVTYDTEAMVIKSEGYTDSFTLENDELVWTLEAVTYTFKKQK